MRFHLLQLVVVVVSMMCMGAAKKPAPLSVRFYAMAESQDTEVLRFSMAIENVPREIVVQKRPIFSEKDIVAFYSFEAHDGSLGVYFQLGARGDEVLKEITTTRQNTYLVPVIDGRPVCMLLIDRPVTDGLIVIPNGLTKEQLFRLGQQFPMINETPAKTKQRREFEKKEKRENEKRS